MDWVAFSKQWQYRDEILLAVTDDRKMSNVDSAAAFFILMILAVGSQYCQRQNGESLLRPYEYFTLALPYLNSIVQLHSLANVQGVWAGTFLRQLC